MLNYWRHSKICFNTTFMHSHFSFSFLVAGIRLVNVLKLAQISMKFPSLNHQQRAMVSNSNNVGQWITNCMYGFSGPARRRGAEEYHCILVHVCARCCYRGCAGTGNNLSSSRDSNNGSDDNTGDYVSQLDPHSACLASALKVQCLVVVLASAPAVFALKKGFPWFVECYHVGKWLLIINSSVPEVLSCHWK